jgi:phage terminase large subunit-like protein
MPANPLTSATLVGQFKRWRRDPVAFITQVLIDPETAKPFELYPAQARFLREALTPTAEGKLPYRELVFSAPKKSGKSTTAALAMLYVIVALGGNFAEGVILANDEQQATDRIFTAAARIVEASPLLRSSAKITQGRIEFRSTGSTITAISSDYASAAGSNPSFITADEIWAFSSERASRLLDEVIVSPAKKVSARLITSYAGFIGEGNLLETLYRRGLQGEEIAPQLYRQEGLLMLWATSQIAPWCDAAWVEASRLQLRPTAFQRLILNAWTTSEARFIDLEVYDACVDPDLRPVLNDKRLLVFAGLDASVRHDTTALAAVTYEASAQRVRVVAHKLFRPGAGEIDFAQVEEAVMDLRSRFNLRSVTFDPFQLASLAQRLRGRGVNMEELPQTQGNLTAAASNLFELIQGRNLLAYPSDELREAVLNCSIVESPRGIRLAKERPSGKIDLAAALSFAALAAVRGGQRQEPSALVRLREDVLERVSERYGDAPVAAPATVPSACSAVEVQGYAPESNEMRIARFFRQQEEEERRLRGGR